MRQHDGLGLWADGSLDFAGVDVVGVRVHIHKHRHSAKLEDGVHRSGEASSYADHFITLLNSACTELGRGQRAEGHQIG